jgi:xanthine dehydrogenase YagS FAD-binding subunit
MAGRGDGTCRRGQVTWIRAGGVDLSRLAQEHIWDPEAVIDLTRCPFPELRRLSVERQGTRIGALVTLEAIANAKAIRTAHAALAAAAQAIATPQIRRRATLGGNLFQSPRCPYFHDVEAECLRRDDAARCGQMIGQETDDAEPGLPCATPHPSTLATALVAYHARAHRLDRSEPLDVMLTRTPGSFPPPGVDAPDLLLSVSLSGPVTGEHASYVSSKQHGRAEWPAVEAVARLVLNEHKILDAGLVLGAVAPLPHRCRAAATLLTGRRVSARTLRLAAEVVAEEVGAEIRLRVGARLINGVVLEALELALDSPATSPESPAPVA